MKKIYSSIIIFLLSTLVHSLYDLFPNSITLIFSPINESIWEHMKLIFTSYILFMIIKLIYYKIKKINKKNTIFKELTLSIFNIIIFLIIYLPIYYIFGENLIVTLSIYYLTILLTRFIKIKKDLNLSLSLLIITIIYILFTYLSYNPILIDIFKDPLNNTYGLNK